MKKFMLSAVALIVFSFAGMANTGGEEKLNVNIEKIESLNSKESLVKVDCFTFAVESLDSHEALYGEMNNDDYTFWVNLIYASCWAGLTGN
jgi:hypothetical protein